MRQPGFFDADRRLLALSEKGDPLEAIATLVPWENFRADIEAVVLTPEAEKKSRAGRKPFDAILIFRMLVLQSLYNLSDEQIEYQVRDRLSFTRFLGLGLEDDIPDGTTLWLAHCVAGRTSAFGELRLWGRGRGGDLWRCCNQACLTSAMLPIAAQKRTVAARPSRARERTRSLLRNHAVALPRWTYSWCRRFRSG
ncbi:MAG TPA: transposase, partial [Casimicrobiaceae bacterium]|nr:transposase [Casimicrobiaceae bacterium]